MESNQNTHLFFSDRGIEISPDITPVFQFLMEIEKEVDIIMSLNKKNEVFKEKYLNILNLVTFLSDKLKENDIYWEYKGSPIEGLEDAMKYDFPIRSQSIVLFASLEVLFVLYIAYEYELTDSKELRSKATDQKIVKKFLNRLILSNNNEFYSQNQQRLSLINSKELRELRNSLTHFFSLSERGLGIVPTQLEEKARKLESEIKKDKTKLSNVNFISPNDLYQLIKSANILWFKILSEDFVKNQEYFKSKIKYVKDVVGSHGAKILHDKNLNI